MMLLANQIIDGLADGAIYASLALVIVIQIANGWVQGMGWPPCGKTMVHWFSTRERGRVVSFWNVGHNVGGGLVATFAALRRADGALTVIAINKRLDRPAPIAIALVFSLWVGIRQSVELAP